MYCSSCGAYNSERALQCEKCGADLYSDIGDDARNQEPIEISNYLVQSILVTVCCCLPFGIVAIIYAAQVNGLIERGDYMMAMEKSRSAKLWCWIGFGIGLASTLIGLTIQIFAAMATANY